MLFPTAAWRACVVGPQDEFWTLWSGRQRSLADNWQITLVLNYADIVGGEMDDGRDATKLAARFKMNVARGVAK